MLNQVRNQLAIRRKVNGGDDTPLYRLHPELADRIHLQVSEFGDISIDNFEEWAKVSQTHNWVNVAINKKAASFAPLPVRVLDRQDQEIEKHQLTDLFTYINDADSSSQLWNGYSKSMDLSGEAFFELVDGRGGQPVEIWYRRPDEVAVLPDKNRPAFPIAAGYRIGDDKSPIPPESMIHIKYHNPLNPYRGIGVIAAIRNSIIIDIYAQSWSKMFLKKGARPDFAVLAPEGITKTEREDLERTLENKFGGIGNVHKPIVLEKGITDIKPFSFPPVDVQWLEQRKLARDEIGAIFGVQDILMGYGPESYDTEEKILSALLAFWLLTMKPFIDYRDEALTNYFTKIRTILNPGERIVTDISGVRVLQEDLSQKLTQAKLLTDLGYDVDTVNDRLNLGMPPIGISKQPAVDSQAALNGAQVNAALGILERVSSGLLSFEIGLNALQIFFNLTEEQARLLVDDSTSTNLGLMGISLQSTKARRALGSEFQAPDYAAVISRVLQDLRGTNGKR